MKTNLAVTLVLMAGHAFAVAAEPAQVQGPFAQGNKAIGTWKTVMTGKLSPFSNDKTSLETTGVSKAAINGWFIESSSADGPAMSKTFTALDPDGTTVRLWMFTQNNVVTLSGKADAAKFTGSDQFGNTAELTDKWIDDDHREGTFTLKAKDGSVLIDVAQKLSRVGK